MLGWDPGENIPGNFQILTLGTGWWICHGLELCLVGASHLEEPSNHYEVELVTDDAVVNMYLLCID